MNSQLANDRMTNREFVALVRAKLDAVGHGDVPIQRLWIEEDTAGEAFLLNVPIGPELVVPLRPKAGILNKDEAEIDYHIGYFAGALVTLKRAEKMLTKYAREIRRAASAEIAKARAEGLDVLLESVGFKPTFAFLLADSDWKDAAHHVLASVRIRHTSFHLQSTVTAVFVEEPEDVRSEMETLIEEQRKYQARLVEIEASGFDLEVDAITLDLLAAHGLEAAKVLRDVWKRQCLNIPVQHLGRDTYLSVTSSQGRITAGMDLGNAYWNGEHLWFNDEELHSGHAELVGKPLGDLVSHPAFSSRLITKVQVASSQGIVDLIHFDLSEKSLFDADTGRLWRDERLAA